MNKEGKTKEIVISPINRKKMVVKVKAIKGSTLIVHRRSPETVMDFTAREREAKKGTVKKKKLRNLDKEYEDCFHYTEDKKYGFPVAGFVGGILFVAPSLDVYTTDIKRGIRLLGDMCELEYEKLNRRIDTPNREGRNRTPDIRHRPEFVNWSTSLLIEYNADLFTPKQVINLINQAGFGAGIGDWRPSAPKSTGSFGMYEVVTTKSK